MIKASQLELALTEASNLFAPYWVEGQDGHYLVSFSPDESVELAYDEPAQCLTLMTQVGALDEQHATSGQRLLLEYSFLHSATGGITMACNPVSGQVVQMYRWPVGQLSIQELATIIENFHDRATLWRQAIADGLGSAGKAEETLQHDFDIHTALRV